MAHMDVFGSSAFNMIELTNAVNQMPYVPTMLGSMGLFRPRPIRTIQFSIEWKQGVIALVPTTARNTPPTTRTPEKRSIRATSTVRLAVQDRITADEIQSIRAFGSDSELKQVQAEVAMKMLQLRTDIALTHENHRLGAIQGIVVDADGASILLDIFDFFGVSAPTPINFQFSSATFAVRATCQQVIREIARAAQVGNNPMLQVNALCGDTWFDALIDHDEVRATFLNWMAAADLRENVAFMSFRYGGINFINYRGSDDGAPAASSTVGVAHNEARFFASGVPGLFDVALSPAEFLPFANTLGQQTYAMQIPDEKRQAHVDLEVYSYPMFYCTRPLTLIQGTQS